MRVPTTPSVSVVVPTYRRRASLLRLLDAIAQQRYPMAKIEVVVVDDGSPDAAPIKAETPFAFRLLRQDHSGPAAARNRGVAAACGEIVVFLDDDVVPDPDLIAVHARSQSEHPNAVVIGPMLPPVKWQRPAWIRWEEKRLVAQYEALVAGAYPCTPRQFFTGNASLPRARFAEAGGFDPTFRRAEDVELGYRLRDRGMQFVFEPRARVWHYPVRSFSSWQLTPYLYGRGDVAMHREKGHEALLLAFSEFRDRHALSRALVRACVGRPLAMAVVRGVLAALVVGAGWLRAATIADPTLSALFNLEYWQGIADELGTGRGVWRSSLVPAGLWP